MRTVYVTTSWDDGHQLDLRLASELAEHGLTGTFYVAPECREIAEPKRLSDNALRELATRSEIGAHTLTHPRLPTLADDVALREIVNGRDAIEQVTGEAVVSFCYPYGAYSDQHPDMVRSAGFTSARTVERFRTDLPPDLFRMGTTTHAYQHLVDGPQIVRRTRSPRRALGMWRNWELLGRRLFEETCSTGGVFHLWGHSWEVDANDDWSRLRSMLKEISDHDVVAVTNGELAAELRAAA